MFKKNDNLKILHITNFNENGEPSFNVIILEIKSTENPNKTLAIEKFLTLIISLFDLPFFCYLIDDFNFAF